MRIVNAGRNLDGWRRSTTGERHRFRSSILPPYARRSPKVGEVLPLLYLHGLSTKDFVPALAEFFGTSSGLSAAAITRLTANWSAEREAFMARDLSEVDYVYVWVGCVPWSSWVSGPTGPRSSWRSPTATGSLRSPGRSSSGSVSAEGCGPRYSRWGTEPWGSGRPSATCSPRPGGNGTGCTRWPTS